MAEKKPGRGSDQFPLRLPDGMRDRVREAAEANGRSMNAEIIARLEQTFEPSPEYTSFGMGALASRLEANAEATEQMLHQMKPLLESLVEAAKKGGDGSDTIAGRGRKKE